MLSPARWSPSCFRLGGVSVVSPFFHQIVSLPRSTSVFCLAKHFYDFYIDDFVLFLTNVDVLSRERKPRDSYLQESFDEIAFVGWGRHGQFVAVADTRGSCSRRSLRLPRERHDSHLQMTVSWSSMVIVDNCQCFTTQLNTEL